MAEANQQAIADFVRRLAVTPAPAGMFNPWRDVCSSDISGTAPQDRQDRLIRHLSAPSVRLILVGEAPGYQGCRYSGMAFTSERLVCEGAIPRVPALPRFTHRPRPWSEPSATIVWGGLYAHGLAEDTILWNSTPWHPHKGTPHTNRTPTPEEVFAGRPFLLELLALFPDAQVAALGRIASKSLTEAGVPHMTLRHPANGGATEFREGLAKIAY